jgi:hypothetical protein
VGFIAQDVYMHLPEVVKGSNPMTLQTSQITAVLVEAIKEQQKQIEALQKQVDQGKMIYLKIPLLIGILGVAIGGLLFLTKRIWPLDY